MKEQELLKSGQLEHRFDREQVVLLECKTIFREFHPSDFNSIGCLKVPILYLLQSNGFP